MRELILFGGVVSSITNAAIFLKDQERSLLVVLLRLLPLVPVPEKDGVLTLGVPPEQLLTKMLPPLQLPENPEKEQP